MTDMKVLITGSTGFIGSAILHYLSNSRNIIVYEWRRDGIYREGKLLYHALLESPESTETVIEEIKPNVVYHCAGAAIVYNSVEHPYEDMIGNYLLTHNLLFAIQKKSIHTKFIFFSSAAVYGNPDKLPMNEDSPIAPLSPYALHKSAAESICIYMNRHYNIDTKILRIFSVYGPGLKKQFFWDMYRKIERFNRLDLIGNGEESRDYIYISDLVEAALLVANSNCNDIVFNVANGEEVKIKDVARKFAYEMGLTDDSICFDGKRREGDPLCWCADISKLVQLGYKRKVSFDEGIREYIRWASRM